MKNYSKGLIAALLVVLAISLSAYAQAPLSNNMPASGVLGQVDFVTRTTGKTASTMNNAFGVTVDPTTGKLFVADRNNNRVLRFSSTAKMINGSAAEAVLGQPDDTTNTTGLSAVKMNTPIRLYVDGAGRLWVSDYGNRRVLRFDGASSKATGSAADGVLGQPDFVTNSAGTTASKMTRTTGLYVDAGGRLWVAERDNNRVLRFDNAAAKPNGAAADGVLGQPDFVTGTGGLSATKMAEPFGVFVDAGGRLWVSEDVNNRAIRFDNAAAKPNGAAADGVLGQPNFTTNTYSTTQNGTGNVRGVWGDGRGRLYLVDEGNSRILVFNNAANLANGANADNVLGQADFTSGGALNPPTASSFAYPNSMFVDNASNQIWVADAGNNRVVRFAVSDVTFIVNMPASGVLGQVDFVTRTTGKTASTMNNAFGVTVDPTTGKLFVADRNNNRVLRFSSTAKMINGSAAEAVLGQPDDTTNTTGLSAVKMNTPIRLYVDGAGRLWVSDYGNRRVLRFDGASSKATGSAADGVLGQPDFVTNSAGTTASKMTRTTGLYVDAGGRLWVAERDNNRVLRFDNAAAKPNGAAADGVLGQPDFVTGTGGLSATKMAEPFGVFVDAGGRLWVSEDVNNRAIRFDNAAAKPNGAAADGVLGQPNFTTNTYSTTQNGTGNVRGVWGDGRGRLYLVDEGNSRILVFNNAANLANGANADNVLGQADFTSGGALNPPTASSFAYPNSMFVDNANNQIWVADAGNNRVVRYNVQIGLPTTVNGNASGQTPTTYSLAQNFPNPFNPNTTITFALKNTEHATVEVYNLLGQKVATLFDGIATSGDRVTLVFNATNLPSGVYLYTLRSASSNQTKKMILMK